MMKSQKGFTALEVSLIIVLVGVLSAVSVFAYSRIQNSSDKNLASSADSEKNSPAGALDKNTNTLEKLSYLFVPKDKKYKINLPDGWKFTYTPASAENEGISYLYAGTQDMKTSPGTPATVKDEVGGYGPETGFTLSVHEHPGPVGYGEGLKSLGNFKTSQGKQVDAFQDEDATEPFGEPSEGSGSDFFAQYEYYIVGSNNTVYKFVYNLSAGDESQKETVEKAIKSIQIP